jgi:lipopolysaccharide/colanic/teichoic acid biosynthesis glycosyltransferase
MQSSDFGTGLPRSVEFAVSLAALVILSPVILISLAAILLSSGGSVFFRQRRIGRLGRVFVLYKLRTMREGVSGPNVTATGDSRITRVGRILRQTKIDEIPELWNVLRGDMSLVGPRPEVPGYVDLNRPEWQQVLLVKPGMTDPVTLRLRNEEKLMAGVKGDREDFYLRTLQPLKLAGYLVYLKQRTWRSDLLIIFRTLICVLFPPRVPESGMGNELTQQDVTTFVQR